MSVLEQSKTYKPFKYPWAVMAAVEHEKIHWHEAEARLNEDVTQWKTGGITPDEKKHITSILRLFTQSDVAVGSNYIDHFLPRFKNNEIRAMLTSFANREFVHQRAYALLNDTLGLPEEEYFSFLEYEEMADKIEFMSQADTHSMSGLAQAVARSACNEGMSLFSAFVMLLNYQRFGKMKGMCEIVEWSIRDETAHVEGMVKLFRTLCDEHPRIVNDEFKRSIYETFRQAVALEDKVIDLCYNAVAIEGLTKEEVKQYIRYLADRRLIQLGLKGNFKVKENPIDWLDWVVNGASFKNFFEGVVTDYSVVGMTGELKWS
ncbi:MAG: ribonucleotide-diphosphate reductase subunit beta [Burkholderiales bacterium]|jgi:ribonucleoside-diphosphate reductase beta chain|nr:ribonucleotide-diphosphate reductase subunit beta [Burkholderiales bacterium]